MPPAEPRARVALLLVSLLVLAGLSACGGGSDDESEELAGRSVLDSEELSGNLVEDSDIDDQAEGSPSRSLLEHWRTLQLQDYVLALDSFDPGLRKAIGTSELVAALQSQSPFYRSEKPEVIGEAEGGSGLTSVRWGIVDSFDSPVIHTSTFRRRGQDWLIVFDTFFGDSLANAAQERAQDQIDPENPTLSPAALAAGARARDQQTDYIASITG